MKKYRYRKRVNIRAAYSRSPKKGRRPVKFFILTLLFAGLCFLLYAGAKKLAGIAYAADSLSIKEIDVSGAKNVSKAEIKALLPFKVGDNILKADLSAAEDEIKKLKPELRDISVNRRWQRVNVRLYERTPEAFVLKGKEIFGIDFDDKPFPLRGFMSAMKIPEIECQSLQERAELLKFVQTFKAVCKDFLDGVAAVKFGVSGDVVLKMRDGTEIFWGEDRAQWISHKFDKFQKIYVDAKARYSDIEYVDMTLYDYGRAVVKPKIQEQI
ncbi:MAG: FtsQ-type POTRA domain-containing protein [Endomicrobium sp.]|nr:FtsQ-type POTRA domain-containing protein [Endomicrobium sp.]